VLRYSNVSIPLLRTPGRLGSLMGSEPAFHTFSALLMPLGNSHSTVRRLFLAFPELLSVGLMMRIRHEHTHTHTYTHRINGKAVHDLIAKDGI